MPAWSALRTAEGRIVEVLQHLVSLFLGDGAIGQQLGDLGFAHGLDRSLHVLDAHSLLIRQIFEPDAIQPGCFQLVDAEAQYPGDCFLNQIPLETLVITGDEDAVSGTAPQLLHRPADVGRVGHRTARCGRGLCRLPRW